MTGARTPDAAPAGTEDDRVEPVAPPSPDGFRLTGVLPRVMRLSRKTIAGAGAAAGIAIGAALFLALQAKAPSEPENLYSAQTRGRPDVLNGKAAGYEAGPMLGRPAPNEGEQPTAATGPADDMSAPMGSPATHPGAADQARDRAEQEAGAALSSRLFLGATGTAAETRSSAPPGGASAADADGATAGAARGGAPHAFLSPDARPIESAERVRVPASPHILQAGSLIPAALITGIRSDLPGQITAQVTENVYDSPTGRLLLIPQGARLIGEYDSEIAAGQNRVLLAWDRLILPGGRSIALTRMPGADAAGMAGLSDRTDYRWGQMLRAALISTLLGVGTELSADGDDRLVRAIRDGTQDSIDQTGRRIVERQTAIPPTLTVRPGHALRVIVTRDLIFEPIGKGHVS